MHPDKKPAPAAQQAPRRTRSTSPAPDAPSATGAPDAAPTHFTTTLGAFVARRGLDELAAAGLLGVPVPTLRKWLSGTRAPSAAAVRLLNVLGTLEALAPFVLDALTPPAGAPKRPRGRPKTKVD